jgi:preprotein translocase subunit Sss1
MDLIEELIAQETGKSSGDPDRISAYRTPSGRRMTYSVPTSADEISRIIKRGKQIATLANATPEWQEFLPVSADTAMGVAFIAELSVDPKLSDLDALKLASGAGAVFLSYAGAIKTEVLVGRLDGETAEIDAAGEGSNATGDVGSASMPVAGTGESILTA